MSSNNPRKKRFGRLVLIPAFAGLIAVDSHAGPDETLNFTFSQTFPAGNLLDNGSFEGNYTTIDFEGWSEGLAHDANAYKQLLFSDIAVPLSGRRFAGIRFSPPAGSSRFLVSRLAPLKPNTWYTFFTNYQTKDYVPAAGNVFASFKTYKDRDIAISETSLPDPAHGKGSAYGSAEAWARYTHRFQTGPDANFGDIALLSAEAGGTGGAFFFDDAYLVEGCVRVTAGEVLPTSCTENIAFGQDIRHPDSVATSQKFFDGNNKPVQILAQDGPRDIVTQMFYDDKGRPVRTTLPIGAEFPATRHKFLPGITATGDANDVLSNFYDPSKNVYVDDFILGSAEKYPDAGHVPYSELRYEESNLGREAEVASPGAPWAMGGAHTTKTIYTSVNDLDAADDPSLPGPDNSTPNSRYFAKEMTGPDGQVTREFTDKLGKLVRSSSKLRTKWVITDYAYDEMGNIISIQAPQDSLGNRLSRSKAYNALGQMVNEITPVTGITRFIYDATGRIRFSQSASQAAAIQPGAGKFSYVKYDALGRNIQTGEITDISLFLPEKAEMPEFPCVSNCSDPGSVVPRTSVRIRSRSQYDDEEKALSCASDADASLPGVGFKFLGKDTFGQVASATYDLIQTYDETASDAQGQSGIADILALYDPAGEVIIVPRPGSEIRNLGNLGFELEAVDLTTPAGVAALAEFKAFQPKRAAKLLGPGEFLQGRLVKSLTCNYELSEALGDPLPKEVSKTYRYDKYGNITKILEINQYAQGTANKTQLTMNRYDTQNRILEKRVCSDLLADPDCIGPLVHIEVYQYDRMGRIQNVTDKTGEMIAQNHYNFIGQPSARGLGGGVFSGTSNSLLEKTTRHVREWTKSISVRRMQSGASMFQATLVYDGSFPTARFDGSQSFATYAYGSGTPLGVIQYGYEYDDLGRLVSSQIGGGSTILNGASTYGYLDDSRISRMTRDIRAGDYSYDAAGRLKEIKGDLVERRDMSLATNGALVFGYDENGNLVTDYSKEKGSQQPLEIFYRSDNLPYMFVYRMPGNGTGYDDLAVYMAYDENGARVLKSSFRNNVWESSKGYSGTGKETREAIIDGNYSSLEIYEMAGAGRITYSQSNPNGYKEYYLKDPLGTTREVYDYTTGALTFASHYFPYGKQFSEFNSNSKGDMRMSKENVTKKFTEKELDEGIELNYFGARYYDQDIGLWISPDPSRQFASPYSYGQNPINTVDPDGKQIGPWPYAVAPTFPVYVPKAPDAIGVYAEVGGQPLFNALGIRGGINAMWFAQTGQFNVYLYSGPSVGFGKSVSIGFVSAYWYGEGVGDAASWSGWFNGAAGGLGPISFALFQSADRPFHNVPGWTGSEIGYGIGLDYNVSSTYYQPLRSTKLTYPQESRGLETYRLKTGDDGG